MSLIINHNMPSNHNMSNLAEIALEKQHLHNNLPSNDLNDLTPEFIQGMSAKLAEIQNQHNQFINELNGGSNNEVEVPVIETPNDIPNIERNVLSIDDLLGEVDDDLAGELDPITKADITFNDAMTAQIKVDNIEAQLWFLGA